MLITHKEEVVFEDDVVDSVLCNMCGKPIYKNQDTGYFDDCLDVEKEWEYNSDYDNQIHIFHLCQDCYKELVKTFKIPVEISEIGE